MQRCSTCFISREMQVKTTVSYNFTSARLTKVKRLTIPGVKDVGQLELSYMAGRSVKRLKIYCCV